MPRPAQGDSVSARPAAEPWRLPVLNLTDNAVEMIQSLTTEADLPEGGLRIAKVAKHPGLTMELAPAPRAEDDVLRERGARLFLDRVAASRLHGQTLDARTNESGSAFFLGT
jgi:Fe-S cluster assembly iron-binding protein IscA